MRQAVQKIANSFGYRISKIREPFPFPYIDALHLILQDYSKPIQDITFVQIGANDGTSADPINQLVRQHHWQGVLVEPQPNIFKRLIENYQSEDQLIFENALICDHDGTETLYAIREQEPKLPFWCYQIANINRDRLEQLLADEKEGLQLPVDVANLIEELTIPALTVSSLFAKHNIQELDLLVIDTLGYDFEIIKLIPFDQIKPSIIHFEHCLLAQDEQRACFEFLTQQQYSFIQVGVDTIAYLKAPTKWGVYAF
ncbi:MAG: FkbM family methyltransferase [Leptolyngbyaceae cyanobacterium RU_5_1]|nr:FkbM family methyltransferase [Leptolyngbyaceae cyanobacterium RU_5_1]